MSKLFLRAALGASAMLAATQAGAVTFVLTDTGGAAIGTQARQGFEIAAAYWSSVLTSSSTVNLRIGFNALPAGVLGSTGSTTAIQFNDDYYASLASHITSSVDATAVAGLRPLQAGLFGVSAVTAQANGFNGAGNGYVDTRTRLDADGTQNNSTISMNTSLAKALGFTTTATGATLNYAASDGSVTFSNLFGFDFDPTNGIDRDKFDFIGVAIHEIGHALGFRSGVDTYDAYTTPAPGSTTTSATSSIAGGLEGFTVLTQLDLFRYSAPGTLDWSTQGVPYFSIDGGATQLFGDSRFATGVRNGDGRQASHFKDSASGVPQLGILDPTSGNGQLQEITALDIAAFDAIGWRTSFDAQTNASYRFTTADAYRAFNAQVNQAVPEPATWALMILGFASVGYTMRRKPQGVRIRFA